MKNWLFYTSLATLFLFAGCTPSPASKDDPNKPVSVEVTPPDSSPTPELVKPFAVKVPDTIRQINSESKAKKRDSSSQAIIHGSPDQQGIDSVKAVKTKNKFK
jgi:hypothetical protein